jgi:hypothetical protein
MGFTQRLFCLCTFPILYVIARYEAIANFTWRTFLRAIASYLAMTKNTWSLR